MAQKITVHIQLEPFNGKKFDFIEVEVNDLSEIAGIYAKLEGKNNDTSTKNSVEMAFYKNGKEAKSKDGKHLTKLEAEKAFKEGKKVWELNYQEIIK